MICFHRWKYNGVEKAYRWLMGVPGGIAYEVDVDTQKCEKCGKVRII